MECQLDAERMIKVKRTGFSVSTTVLESSIVCVDIGLNTVYLFVSVAIQAHTLTLQTQMDKRRQGQKHLNVQKKSRGVNGIKRE